MQITGTVAVVERAPQSGCKIHGRLTSQGAGRARDSTWMMPSWSLRLFLGKKKKKKKKKKEKENVF